MDRDDYQKYMFRGTREDQRQMGWFFVAVVIGLIAVFWDTFSHM